MPIYKAKEFDTEKIQEVVRAHPNQHFEIGMREDWAYVHEELHSTNQCAALGVNGSWWDTPILKAYDGDGHFIAEIEVWKEVEFETTEENYNLHEKTVKEMKKRNHLPSSK